MQINSLKKQTLLVSTFKFALVTILLFITYTAASHAAPQTFTVTTDADSGAGSLRQAIADANGNGNPSDQDVIEFNIPGAGDQTITLTSNSFVISESVKIDGYTQSDSTPNTVTWPGAMNGQLRVYIDANAIGVIGGSATFTIAADNTTIQGLSILRSAEGPIRLTNADNVQIRGNYLNTKGNSTDLYTGSWDGFGVGIDSNSNNAQIGGSNPEYRNVITSRHNAIVAGESQDAIVQGNNIHVGADGSSVLHNSDHAAISFYGVNNLKIGGAAIGEGNKIANSTFGILGQNYLTSDNVLIAGNHITDVTYQVIEAHNTTNLVIGGTTATAGNTLGNGGVGLSLRNVDGAEIYGNYIGVDDDGTTSLANSSDGINIYNGSANIKIGGNNSGEANTISSNTSNGISIFGNSSYVDVIGNEISSNGGSAVRLQETNGVTIHENSISDNQGEAIRIIVDNTSVDITDNVITGNAANAIYGDNQIDDLTIDNNNINNNGLGITLYSSGAATLTNNQVTSNVGRGLTASAGNSLDLTVGTSGQGNTFSLNESGVSAESNVDLDLTENIIEDNTYSGVSISNTAIASIINNEITNNGGKGITHTATGLVSIVDNVISDNNGLGIDLGDNNVSNNDISDSDSGPNDYLNFPDNLEFKEDSGNTNLTYVLDVPSGDYKIEFYANTTADSSGHGEGEVLIGTHNVSSDGSGSQNHAYTLNGINIPNISATATRIDNSITNDYGPTSEFSATATEKEPFSDLALTKVINNPEDYQPGGSVEYTVTLSNNGPDPQDLNELNDIFAGRSLFYDYLPPRSLD